MKKRLNPLVSVVIPCFNCERLIENCLKSLFNQSYLNFEIILVDDCSMDNTLELVEKFKRHKNLRVIQNTQNSGPSKCRNLGINIARGEYVAFFETDMEADANWLRTLVDAFEVNPKLGAAHSRIMDLKRKKYIQADGMKMIPHTGWVVMRNYGLTPTQSDKSADAVIIGSVGTFVRKKILRQISGFDEKLGHKVDDIDLGWRIWLAGYKTVNLPQAIAYHWGGKPQSARSISNLKSEIYFNRMPRVFLKNYGTRCLLRFFPWMIILYGLRGFRHLFSGNPRPLLGYLIALGQFIYELPDTLRRRMEIQQSRKVSDEELLKNIMLDKSLIYIWFQYVIPTHQTASRIFS